MSVALKKYKLGDLMDVTRGASLAGEHYATEGDLVRLTLGNFDYDNCGFKENTSKDNIYYTGDVNESFILNEGDVITPLTEQTPGLLGTTARIPESGKYIQSQDVALIKCNPDLLDQDFAYYLLPSKIVKEQLAARAQQTKIRHTSPDKIKDCTVFVPSVEEQKKIAKILRSIDDKIAINSSIIRILDITAKELFEYYFNNNLVSKNDWTATTLGAVAEMYQPKTISTTELNPEGRYRVYGANGQIGYYDQYNHVESEIAMACRGNSCGVMNRTMPYSWITGNAMVIKPKDKSIHNEFLAQLLKYANIDGVISGSGQPQLTRESLNMVTLLWPPMDIIRQYSEAVKPIIETILMQKEATDKLKATKDRIIPLIMSGQIAL